MEKKYENTSLTMFVFKELMYEIFKDRIFGKGKAIKEVKKLYIERGGDEKISEKQYSNRWQDFIRNEKDKTIEKVFGEKNRWRYICYILRDKEQVTDNVINNELDESEIENLNFDYVPQKIIGEGHEAVYVYYIDIYKKMAQMEDRNTWECKIGRTQLDASNRVREQFIKTPFPEMPVIALAIRCDNAAKLEKLLHAYYDYYGMKNDRRAGSEWFITSPEQVEKLYFYLNENIVVE